MQRIIDSRLCESLPHVVMSDFVVMCSQSFWMSLFDTVRKENSRINTNVQTTKKGKNQTNIN